MSDLADRFFSDLHRGHLKPAGFKKERRTFKRRSSDFIERFQFQGSQWNNRSRPWVFYINVGLQFPDLLRMEPDKDFPHTHANDRIERFLAASGERWELTEENYQTLLVQLALLIEKASGALEPFAKQVYPRCKSEGRQWMFMARET